MINFSQLSLDSDYSQFQDFDCNYPDESPKHPYPYYAESQIKCLSRYLSHPNGARADLKRGYGVTTVAYVNGDAAGYFTLMAGSIYEPRLPMDCHPEDFSFTCKTYPAIKISRFAVSARYQGQPIAKYRYMGEDHPVMVKDLLFNEILVIGDTLSCIDEETSYGIYDDNPDRIGVRFIITDALAVTRTLKFYRKLGFNAFMPGNTKDCRGENKEDNIYEKRITDIIDGKWKPEKDDEMAIPMFFDLHNDKRWAIATGHFPTFIKS